jgi:peptidyl-prolyl cis-trans isomerase NIMA-interacting 1
MVSLFHTALLKPMIMTPAAQSESGLPADWIVKQSTSRNLPYYFNTQSRESRWDPPDGTDTEVLKTFMANNHSAANTRTEGVDAGDGKIRAAHLLVKHNESRRPQSWRETNITRSKDDALGIIKGYQEQIESGHTTLGDLAVSESDCSSARKRGDLGFFGKNEMQREFEENAFALKPGEVSGIVETASGFHLIERSVIDAAYSQLLRCFC